MTGKFFEQDFNIREYIAKRTLEMKSLSDRSIYKEIASDMLTDLYEYHEKSYQNLCNDIMNEVDPITNENPIYIGLSKHNEYDETDEFLYPMEESDFFKESIFVSDIENSLKATGSFEIGKLYFDGNLQMLNNFKSNIGRYDGKLVTTKGEYSAKFEISFDDRYLNKVAEIYNAFKFNQKKWFPICTAYLMRFFKIDLWEIEEKIEGEYQGFHISLIENSEFLKVDVFPIWNILKASEATSIYPKPIKEKVVYEHKIFAHFLSDTSTYLLSSDNPDVLQISRNSGDLLIRTTAQEAVQWSLMEIRPYRPKEFKNILLSSEYAHKVIDMFLHRYQSSVKTKSELTRFLKNLPFSEYIEFTEFEVRKSRKETFDTYNMDEFEEDEIRTEYENTLVLSFEKAEKDHMLISDFMSFYVTQVQTLFPEYKCVGKLI